MQHVKPGRVLIEYRFLRLCTYILGAAGRFRLGHRVGEQAHGQHDAQHQAHQDHPEFGLAVLKYAPDAGLGAHFAKGQRAGGHGAAGNAVSQQGGGIAPAAAVVHVSDHRFVTGLLHVPAEHGVGKPAQGIEPVHAEQQIAQRLPDVIPPPQMGALMGQHIVGQLPVHVRGQIDAGLCDAQHKGRADVVAQVYIFAQTDGHLHLLQQPDIADQSVEQHHAHSNGPQQGQYRLPGEGGGSRRSSLGRRGLGEGRGGNRREGAHGEHLGRRGNGLGHQAHPALQ